ncbi:hypothetical protein M3599_15310 [Niallia circulans]|uniref:hypothetical protein n=1 Tax=Niallia circulans TaxID=1397 RepID=UPI00203B0FCA|nr:hypothetical protein [Niallia circulans]MCM2982293.1 hypothetical protein [Niallia circulans]
MRMSSIENFNHLSQFKDIKDFNNNVEQWMIDLKAKFTKSELIALKRLIRFSAKVVGVCNARIGTLTAATFEDGNGISRSTFKRMVMKAKEMRILTVHETVRTNGSQSSNIYVFNRFELPKEKIMDHHKTNNLSKTININNNLRTTNDKCEKMKPIIGHKKELDSNFVSERVPKPFVNLVKYFFNSAKTIEEYWKMVEISAFKQKINLNSKEILEVALQAFRLLIRKLKLGKIKSEIGFFYGVCIKKFKTLYVKNLFESYWEVS